MSHPNIASEGDTEVKSTEGRHMSDCRELEDLLDNALLDFKTKNNLTQTIDMSHNTESKLAGKDEEITKFQNNLLQNISASPNKVNFDISIDKNLIGNDTSTANNSNVNIECVDKLLKDFQQKINDIMVSSITEFPMASEGANSPDNNEALTEEMQKKFCKMAQDTMNTLINQGVLNQDEMYNNNNDNSIDFKNIISQVVQNLSQNTEELDGGILSSDELEKLINNLTFKDGDEANETEIEAHFMKIFIKIGQMLLYPPLKEICEKYPTYLRNNKLKLSKENYDNYEKQFLNMIDICKLFEKDDVTIREHNFQNILTVMQEIQNCGLPPEELIEGNPFKIYDDMVGGFCNQKPNNLKNLHCSIL